MGPAGAFFVENGRSRSRWAMQPFLSRKITTGKPKYDRFIPNRSSMDMELAKFLLMQTEKENELNKVELSPSKEAYRKRLVEVVLQNRTRILSFNSKPVNNHNLQHYAADHFSSDQLRFLNRRRWIPKSAERMLDAPDIVDDHCLNLLDWGSSNVLAIALGNSVYLWDASGGLASEIMNADEDHGPVTSVSWAPDGQTIAIGLSNSEIHLWDSTSARRLRTLKGIHQSRVGALSWNNHILTTGGADCKITNNDVRIRSHVVQTYVGHRKEVCGLKWSGSGRSLASGGDDNLLHIWDVSMASSTASQQEQWLHRFDHHKAAVRALAWCPFQSSLLASGGGENDRCIKFWNTNTGACLNSVYTESSVCALLWNKNERELLSSHGLTRNQLTLWRYPSMVKMAELMGHTSRVLFMSQSPDGCTVASASGDERLQLWNVFGTPGSQKPTTNTRNAGSVSGFDHIR